MYNSDTRRLPYCEQGERIRYALVLEYKGTHYAGFQVQENARTIQGEVERALSILLGAPTRITFAGRTDAGVHASAQVISFPLEGGRSKSILDFQKDPMLLARSLNGILDKDISVCGITRVRDDFHPRYLCVAREYEYLIWNHPLRSTFWAKRALWLPTKIDEEGLEGINHELASILGLHDFSAFSSRASEYKNTKRHLYSALIFRDGNKGDEKEYKDQALLRFQICANAFLYNMIRILVGTVLEIRAGRLKSSLKEIMLGRERKEAGPTAPPVGLYFRRAYYPPNLEISSPSVPQPDKYEKEERCLAVWDSSVIKNKSTLL